MMQSRHVLKIGLVRCSSGRQQEHDCSHVTTRSSRDDGVGTELRLVVNLQFVSAALVADAEQIVTFRFGDPSLASMYDFRRIKSPLAAASCAPHHRFLASRVAAMACAVVILGTCSKCYKNILREGGGRILVCGCWRSETAIARCLKRVGQKKWQR